MALDALWAVLIPEVSQVSEVQAPNHEGLRDTPAVLPEVSRVSSNDSGSPFANIPGDADTLDTPPEIVGYQVQSAFALGCTLDTPDTPEKINNEACATNDLLWGEELTAAQTYHIHHFNCNTCIAAGRGNRYVNRCNIGLGLWNTYRGTYRIRG